VAEEVWDPGVLVKDLREFSLGGGMVMRRFAGEGRGCDFLFEGGESGVQNSGSRGCETGRRLGGVE
jgi:hypothetical protein